MLKQLILLLLITASTNIYAQCTTCNSLSEALKNPEQVTAIKINSMQNDTVLKEFPQEISKFINLRILWLSSHEIKSINKDVCKLENLKSLSLAENHLKDLPECIYEMKNLKEIILLNNDFTEKAKTAIKARFAKSNHDIKVEFDM